MKPSHEYTLTVTIPCTADAERQAEIFSKVREHYVALKAASAEFGGTGAVAVVRKVTRTSKSDAFAASHAAPKLAHG